MDDTCKTVSQLAFTFSLGMCYTLSYISFVIHEKYLEIPEQQLHDPNHVTWPHHALRLTIKLSHHRTPCSLISFWFLFFTQAPHPPLTPLPVALLLLISLVPSGSDHVHPLPKSFSRSCLGISPMSPLLWYLTLLLATGTLRNNPLLFTAQPHSPKMLLCRS